jgi:hypothetical protein
MGRTPARVKDVETASHHTLLACSSPLPLPPLQLFRAQSSHRIVHPRRLSLLLDRGVLESPAARPQVLHQRYPKARHHHYAFDVRNKDTQPLWNAYASFKL